MLLLAALLEVSQVMGEGPELPPRECARIVVTSRPGGAPGPVFSATKILDVVFEAHFPRRLRGPHVLALQVYTPHGHLYQVLTVPFTGFVPPGDRERSRGVAGFPSPLREEEMKEVSVEGRTRFAVQAALPVAGTWIMTNSLYGPWTVDAFLDGQPATCGRGPTRFTITP